MSVSSGWIAEFAKANAPNPYQTAAFNPYGGLNSAMAAGVSYPMDPQKPLQGTVNNEFWQWTRSGLNYYFNPDSVGVPVYEEMYTSDESCRSAMQFLCLATLAKFGRYVNGSKKIEEWVTDALANMETPWLQCLKEVLTATWAGHSTTEIIVDYEGDKVVPRQLQTLHPGTITFDLWLDGPLKNTLRAARQWRFQSYSSYLPSEKVIVFSQDKVFGNIYGQSRLRACWRSWFLKTKMLAAWALVLDRYGSPHAVATVKSGSEVVIDPDTGTQSSIMPYVTDMLDKLAVNGSIAVTDDVTIELHQAKQAVGNDFGGFIDYLDKMIYRASLIPSLVGDHGSNGSYALGKSHYDLFVLMLEEQAQSLSHVLINQFIKRLIIYNFGKQADYGSFLIEDFQQDDEKLVSEVFKNCVNTGILKPGLAKDLNAMRERLGVGPLTQAEIDSQPEIVPNPASKNPEEAPPGEAPTTGKPDSPDVSTGNAIEAKDEPTVAEENPKSRLSINASRSTLLRPARHRQINI